MWEEGTLGCGMCVWGGGKNDESRAILLLGSLRGR